MTDLELGPGVFVPRKLFDILVGRIENALCCHYGSAQRSKEEDHDRKLLGIILSDITALDLPGSEYVTK